VWFYNLGVASWQDTYALARALAQLGREGALVASSKSSSLCVGGDVSLNREIDSEYCCAENIRVVRRENHSRAMCFAQSHLELQVVLKPGHRLLSTGARQTFRAVLLPLLEVCRDLQLHPEYRAPNEILVRGRQIAAGCITEIAGCVIAAASLTLDYNAKSFARLLNTQDDHVRARLFELVRERRTSLSEELGWSPPSSALARTLRGYVQHIVGGMRPGVIDTALRAQMASAAADPWAERARHDAPVDGWNVYIGAGAEMRQRTYKAPGGMLRATCEWQDGKIIKALLSGDLFCYPAGGLLQLEEALVGVSSDQVAAKIDQSYHDLGLVTPGVQPEHWARVLAPQNAQVI
jgi:lipoate-protein ligase A